MADANIKVSSSSTMLGLFVFLSTWLVFGRGCDNQPSSFELYLKAKYDYTSPTANWDPVQTGDGAPGEQVRAFELIEGQLVEKPAMDAESDPESLSESDPPE